MVISTRGGYQGRNFTASFHNTPKFRYFEKRYFDVVLPLKNHISMKICRHKRIRSTWNNKISNLKSDFYRNCENNFKSQKIFRKKGFLTKLLEDIV